RLLLQLQAPEPGRPRLFAQGPEQIERDVAVLVVGLRVSLQRQDLARDENGDARAIVLDPRGDFEVHAGPTTPKSDRCRRPPGRAAGSTTVLEACAGAN